MTPRATPRAPPEDLLAVEGRRRVHDAVRDAPGLHVRELARRLGMPEATVRHHLAPLRAHGLVEARPDGRRVRLHPAGSAEPPALAALRQAPLRRTLLRLLEAGGEMEYQALRRAVRVPDSTLSTRLATLARRGLARRVPQGRRSRWRVVGPQRVVALLRRHRASLQDPEVDAFLRRPGDA